MTAPTPYIGRLAPSPTGLLHLGHAATFLTASDRARNHHGKLYLRIDDLDLQRSKEHFIQASKGDLLWLGIIWDEEVRESQRLATYIEAMQQLIAKGYVYPCTCSRKDLQLALSAPHEESDDEPVYNGHCRPHLSSAANQIQPRTNYRFRVPDGETIHYLDGACGPQQYTAGSTSKADFGDFLVWRKDGLPSYQLSCVVDDATMGITEVVRGRDLLKSTARQLLLQRALGHSEPAYFHTELLRGDNGQRLAKRHDALSLRTLREQGISPATLRETLRINDASQPRI